MDLKAVSSSDLSKKKVPKDTFYDPAGVVLGNIKHSDDKRNISLVKLGSGGMYLDMDSKSSCGEDNMVLEGVNGESLLNLAATTPKAKKVDSNIVFGSSFGSPNFDMNKEVELLPPPLNISLERKWIDPKIVKTPVEVSVRKSFALDINFLAVEDKSATAKTQFIRKIFSTESLIKTISLARKKGIIINSNLKKQEICSDWAVVIKKIPMNMLKKMIITTISEFVHVTMTMGDHNTWMFRDCFRVLLFTLPVGTTVHDFGTLLEGAGRKTCVINHSLETGNQTHCTIVSFESENELDFAKLDLVWCEKCGKFGHSALKCDASDTLMSALSKKSYKKTASDKNCVQLARLYAKKNVPISCLTAFDISSASFSGGLLFESGSGSGSFSSGASGMGGGSSLALTNNSSLDAYLSSLKHSLELLGDQMYGILHKLNSMELVPLVFLSSSNSPVILINVELDSNLNMVLKSSVVMPVLFPVVSALGPSSSKILMTKMGYLESKLVALEAFIGSVLVNDLIWKFATCNVRGLNVRAKQDDVI
ncbi:hypothetical protein G9A89_002274 [Geosiphon pyriformis]|nr:hypothetical protein G9A89_002274 [Geosiphon pyriformis]